MQVFRLTAMILSEFPEGTDRVSAHVALHAEAPMAQSSHFFSSDPFPGKDTGKDQIKDRGFGIHAAGRNA